MDFDGRRRQEWIRVCRVQADESRRGPCLVSVEFLPLEPAGAGSIRGAVLRLRAAVRGRISPRRPDDRLAIPGSPWSAMTLVPCRHRQ